MSESRTTAVHRVEFDVDWPPGHVACYLLDGPEPVLVDAGMPEDPEDDHDRERTLREGLAAAGVEPADVAHLVVTHPHVDHLGQVPTVIAAGDPTVYAPAGIRERFAGGAEALADRVERNARAAGIEGGALEEAVGMAVRSLERDRELLPPSAVDRWVVPGEPLDVGGHTFEPTHTPGHQADHLVYRTDLDGESVLLAGDAAMEPFRAVAIHDGLDDGVFEAFDAYYAALDRLAALDVDRVHPGHGGVHRRFAEVVARDRRSLDRRLDGVERALDEGVRTVAGVADRVAGDRPVRYLLPEAYAAVAHLASVGRATATVEDGVRQYEPVG
jgi:glyoxylase-like metal-dependent hydrolase (beta-lactamase superfamily II)